MTLILMNDRLVKPGTFRLAVRESDLSGTSYTPIATIPGDMARDLLAGDPSILDRTGRNEPSQAPGVLYVMPRQDPQPGAALWTLNILRGTEIERINYLSDERLEKLISAKAGVQFPQGEPDWARHQQLKTRLRVAELRRQADDLEASITTTPGSTHWARIDTAEIVDRIIGSEGYVLHGAPIEIVRGASMKIFTHGELKPMDESPEELHFFNDTAGGFRLIKPDTGATLRHGHLSEFSMPGFEVAISTHIRIFDTDQFIGSFGFDPREGGSPEGLGRLFMPDGHLASLSRLKGADIVPDGDQRFNIRACILVPDEKAFMRELRNVFEDLWMGGAGFPYERAAAVFEACVASNANPSPDLCGYMIEGFDEIEVTGIPDRAAIEIPVEGGLEGESPFSGPM